MNICYVQRHRGRDKTQLTLEKNSLVIFFFFKFIRNTHNIILFTNNFIDTLNKFNKKIFIKIEV